MTSIPTTRPVMKLSSCISVRNKRDDECDDDDQGGAVVDADDAAVAAIVRRDPIDPCLVGDKESDSELHQPLHTERDQHDGQHDRH